MNITVLLPIFPDDILCIVAGGVKMDFTFFMIVNLICRFLGLITMIYSLGFAQSLNDGGFPWTLLAWGVALVLNVIALIVMKIMLKRKQA